MTHSHFFSLFSVRAWVCCRARGLQQELVSQTKHPSCGPSNSYALEEFYKSPGAKTSTRPLQKDLTLLTLELYLPSLGGDAADMRARAGVGTAVGNGAGTGAGAGAGTDADAGTCGLAATWTFWTMLRFVRFGAYFQVQTTPNIRVRTQSLLNHCEISLVFLRNCYENNWPLESPAGRTSRLREWVDSVMRPLGRPKPRCWWQSKWKSCGNHWAAWVFYKSLHIFACLLLGLEVTKVEGQRQAHLRTSECPKLITMTMQKTKTCLHGWGESCTLQCEIKLLLIGTYPLILPPLGHSK